MFCQNHQWNTWTQGWTWWWWMSWTWIWIWWWSGWWWWMMMMMVGTYASATCEQPACLSNEPLHIGEALLPKVERNVNDVCHKAKCCKTLSEKSTYHWEQQCTIIDVWNITNFNENKNSFPLNVNLPCNGEWRKRVKRPPLLLCSWNVAGMSCEITDALDTAFHLLTLVHTYYMNIPTRYIDIFSPVVTWGQQVAYRSSGGGWRRQENCLSPTQGRSAWEQKQSTRSSRHQLHLRV